MRAKNHIIYTYFIKIANFRFNFNFLKGPSIDFFLKHVSKIYYVPSIQNVPICLWALKLGLFSTVGGTVVSVQQFPNGLLFQVLKDEADSEQEERWKGWSPSNNFDGLPEPIEIPEEHHHDITKIEELLAKEPLPRRVLSPGRALGLSVMLNVEESEYDCSGSESVGFKVSKVSAI